MAKSPEGLNELNIIEYESLPKKNDDIEVQPLAFTVQFEDNVDSNKKLHINDKLSKFAIKHRRNPSLPDFGAVTRSFSENKTNQTVTQPTIGTAKHFLSKNGKGGYYSEGYFSSDQEEEKKNRNNKNVATNGSNIVSTKSGDLTQERKRLTDHINRSKLNKTNNIKVLPSKMSRGTNNVENNPKLRPNELNLAVEHDNKSDTVSEAGTYTLDKDEIKPELEEEEDSVENEDEEEEQPAAMQVPSSYQLNHKWINDWVCQVAKQNFNYDDKSESQSPVHSKIPSPIGTLPKIKKNVSSRLNHVDAGGNKSLVNQHRRSSSLSAKDLNDYKASDTGTSSSLETQSYLRTTESVVSAMQTRMKIADSEPKTSAGVIHQSLRLQFQPLSMSDTDTNSENENKKKNVNNPITSTRLNRAFSLRRARIEPESDTVEKKKTTNHIRDVSVSKHQTQTNDNKRSLDNIKQTTTNVIKNKPPVTSPFSRTDCGRFSTRSTTNTPKTLNNIQKKEFKKPTAGAAGGGGGGGGRSNSSLSSREVEFQNWKRRKSFDPMKAAAEGRKKEQARKVAAMTQSVTQSVNLGSSVNPRSNPVLRSASFHSSPQQMLATDDIEIDEPASPEEVQYSPGSSWVSNHPILPPNSPTKSYIRAALIPRATLSNSRGSLTSMVSTTHSSPSRRAKLEALDSLVTTAISDLSYKLKGKSYTLLKKLSYAYDTDDERSDRLREQIATLEYQQQQQAQSGSGSPVRHTSRDLSTILKNLKSLENVLKVLDDVLFDENIEICIDS